MTLASSGLHSSNDDSVVIDCDEREDGPVRAPSSTDCDRAVRHIGGIDEILPHLPGLRRYLRRRFSDCDTDDIIQDVLVALVRRGGVADVLYPDRYLFSAANAAVIDRQRRQKVRAAEQHVSLEEIDHPIDELSPLRILLAKDEVLHIEHRLARLPVRTQDIVRAVRIEGLSYKDLAQRYNVSTSAIEKHVTRGLRALNAGWSQDGERRSRQPASNLRQRFLAGAI